MKILHAAFAAGTVIVLAACLNGCSNNSPYFQNDGPPRFFADRNFDHAPNAIPKVEAPHRGANRPYTINGVRYYPITGDKPMTQIGVASWYGKQFHGKKTSTGETYNMYAMTAAHPTMQLPSYARVTNLANGKSVIVRVNDRGPFLRSRIMDLSYAAASKLGYVKNGTAKVKVERLLFSDIQKGRHQQSNIFKHQEVTHQDAVNDVMALEALLAREQKQQPAQSVQINHSEQNSASSITAPASWHLQFGAYRTQSNAIAKQHQLQALGVTDCFIQQENGLYRVLIGNYINRDLAEQARSALMQKTNEKPALLFN